MQYQKPPKSISRAKDHVPLLYTKVYIKGYPFMGMIDTGATTSVIAE